MSDSVTVIIPCRNEAKHIRLFLEGLVRQEAASLPWEVIIADGMSTDGTREVLRECCVREPRIRVIDNPAQSVASGLNAAIRVAAGNIIIRMDCHTEYAPDYILKCVETLKATGADNVGGPARTIANSLMAKAISAAYHSPFSTGGAKFHNENYEGSVDTVTYGCWYKSKLEELGLFDEMLIRNQDDEFNLRLTRAGGVIWQSPAIVSFYHARSDLRSLFRQYMQYGFWKVLVIRKHRMPGSWRHLVPGVFSLCNLVALIACIVSMIAQSSFYLTVIGSIWGASLALYALACLGASSIATKRYGWSIFPLLPAAFVTFHVSYGLGFLFGMAYWSLHKPAQGGRAFTKLSR
jgi:succinoglycan biosynthesis protein ExoA